MKINGEMAVRSLSDKARAVYNDTDPLAVYEYEQDGTKLYAYTGALGEGEDLTFEQLNQMFEDVADEYTDID